MTRTQGAPSSPGSCAATVFGSPTTINANVTATGTISDTVPLTGQCYQYTLTGTDNVGNTATVTSHRPRRHHRADRTDARVLRLHQRVCGRHHASTSRAAPPAASPSPRAPPTTSPASPATPTPASAAAPGHNTNGVYTFTSAATTQTGSVTAKNNAGLTGSGTSFTAQIDATAPSGGAFTANGHGRHRRR